MLFRLKNFSVLLALLAFFVFSCKENEKKKVEPTDPCDNTSIVVVPSVSGNTLTISASNGAEPYTYSINGVSFVTDPGFSDLNEGDYTVSVKDTNGCTASVNISIQEPDPTTLTDSRDGQTYKLVTIGDQTWMAENLNYETSESYCYEDNSENCNNYGKLYTWEAAQNACPNGYHLPSDEEWKTLESALGMPEEEVNSTGYRGTDEGEKLKQAGSSNLNAIYGGYRGTDGSFLYLGATGNFWSSTESSGNESYALLRTISNQTTMINRSGFLKTTSYSVRCVAD